MSEYQVMEVRQKERCAALRYARALAQRLRRALRPARCRYAALRQLPPPCSRLRQGPGPRPPLMRGPPGPLSGVPFGAALPRGSGRLRAGPLWRLFRPAFCPLRVLPPRGPCPRARPLRGGAPAAGPGPACQPSPSARRGRAARQPPAFKAAPLVRAAPSAVCSAPPVPLSRPPLPVGSLFGRPWLSPCGPSVPCRVRRVLSAGPPAGLWARSGSGRGGAGGRVAAFFALCAPRPSFLAAGAAAVAPCPGAVLFGRSAAWVSPCGWVNSCADHRRTVGSPRRAA